MPVSVRIPEELRETIDQRAAREERSVSREIVWLIRQGLEAVEQREKQTRQTA
jgi:metal-responsive CopG/Arc/MetJ family transcriptional regulator